MTDFGTITTFVGTRTSQQKSKSLWPKSLLARRQVAQSETPKVATPGTPAYKSPEVWAAEQEGVALSEADGKSADVWSFGTTLWALIYEVPPDVLKFNNVEYRGGPELTMYIEMYKNSGRLPMYLKMPEWPKSPELQPPQDFTGGEEKIPKPKEVDVDNTLSKLVRDCHRRGLDHVPRPSFDEIVRRLGNSGSMTDSEGGTLRRWTSSIRDRFLRPSTKRKSKAVEHQASLPGTTTGESSM